MNILHVCDSIVGGTGTYLAELLPLQADTHGAENIVLLMPEQHRSHVEDRIVRSGIRIETFDRKNRLSGMATLARRYPRIRHAVDPDIVHAHSFGAGFVTRTMPARRSRVVFCPHGWAFDMEGRRSVQRAIATLERILATRASRIVLISHYERDRARAIGIGATKLDVVANGIDPAVPAVVPAPWSDHRLKALFVGRFDRQKGLDVLFAARAGLGERIALRTVGAPVVSGDPAFDVPDDVEQLGWLPREAVAAQMAACDVLVVPSRWEGFGLVAVEAMRLGKAVVASDVGGLSEILGPDRYGFSVPPDDVDALRDCLSALTPPEIARRADLGHRRFRECYTADRMAAEIDRVYERAVAA